MTATAMYVGEKMRFQDGFNLVPGKQYALEVIGNVCKLKYICTNNTIKRGEVEFGSVEKFLRLFEIKNIFR